MFLFRMVKQSVWFKGILRYSNVYMVILFQMQLISAIGKLFVWIPGIPLRKVLGFLGVPRFKSQTAGSQTTNLPLVDIVDSILGPA